MKSLWLILVARNYINFCFTPQKWINSAQDLLHLIDSFYYLSCIILMEIKIHIKLLSQDTQKYLIHNYYNTQTTGYYEAMHLFMLQNNSNYITN